MRVLLIGCVLAAVLLSSPQATPNFVAGEMIRLNDNGAWSWFMDERTIVDDGKLIVGSVRAVGTFQNSAAPDWGNVEISVLDLKSKTVNTTVLHRHFEQDDHDGPALMVMPDGRYFAMYTKHGVERRIYYRFSEPKNPLAWGPAIEFETPGKDAPNFRGDNTTYSNLFRLPGGRILNLFRGFDFDPNYMYSDDNAKTWKYGGRLMKGRDGYSPYLKYAYDGDGTIHFVSTEDHPRNFDNSLYHGFIRNANIYQSDGTLVGPISTTTDVNIHTWDVTKVFQGDPDNVAWMVDIELDAQKRPYVVFSVQKDGRGLPPRQGGMDHRFHFARWNGKAWQQREIAYAGTRLYPFEDDYTGLAALDPNNPDVMYISTDADPVTGAPLVSKADGNRHRELYRGTTRDGVKWQWEPLTANSDADNIRPLVPKWKDPRTALVWMRGSYTANRGTWTTAVVAMILPPRR
jgi:putative BNR repeat neuraminidase